MKGKEAGAEKSLLHGKMLSKFDSENCYKSLREVQNFLRWSMCMHITEYVDEYKIKVLIAEDQALLRSSLKVYLETQGSCEVVGEANDSREAMLLFRYLKPDVVLLGLPMPGMDGIVAVRSIRRDFPEARIIALTPHRADKSLHAVLDYDMDGYVIKTSTPEDLLTAIQSVCRGETHVSPESTVTLINGYLRRRYSTKPTQLEMLTTRETHILDLVLSGMKNKEIAEKLLISTRTVEKHRDNFTKKLGKQNLRQVREFVKAHGTPFGIDADTGIYSDGVETKGRGMESSSESNTMRRI